MSRFYNAGRDGFYCIDDYKQSLNDLISKEIIKEYSIETCAYGVSIFIKFVKGIPEESKREVLQHLQDNTVVGVHLALNWE